MASILASLTFQNALTFATLVVIAIPAYFVWVFLHDKELRRELLSSLEVLDAGVPCLVYVAQQAGQMPRYSVGSGYASDGKFERLIAVRSPGLISQTEIRDACDLARKDADIMRKALAQ